MSIKLILASVFILTAAHAGVNEAWEGFSKPAIMSSGFTHKLNDLPLEGSVVINPRAWSGGYWATQKGSINIRWNTPTKEGFDYNSPSRAQVQNMSLDELAKLAPTEKYDLFTGKYDYPMKTLVAARANPDAKDWNGICHGWAPASLHHNEPTPKVLKNPDGIEIPFGSSDIKALLSYYYAYYHKTESSHQVGLRCYFGQWLGGKKSCDQDLNAGAFHIIITNMLGLRKQGFVGDLDRYKEVWNQPIVAYNSKIVADNLAPTRNAATQAVKEMRIQTEFFYVDESDNDTWVVAHGSAEQFISKKTYKYRIEIDSAGQIVGGTWESESRPDFFWYKEPAKEFKGILSKLPELLND